MTEERKPKRSWRCGLNPQHPDYQHNLETYGCNRLNSKKILDFVFDVSKSTGIFLVVGIVAMFFVIFGFAGYIWLNAEPPTPPTFKQGHFQEIANPMNTSQTFEITVNLLSKTFGAQSEIDVYVRLDPISEQRQNFSAANYSIPANYKMWFDGTYCQDSPNRYLRIHSCSLELTREPKEPVNWWNVHWLGNTVLNYTTSGVFDVALGTETSIESQRIRTGDPFIRIESVEATNSFSSVQQSTLLQARSLGVSYLALAMSVLTAYLSFIGIVAVTRYRADKAKTKPDHSEK